MAKTITGLPVEEKTPAGSETVAPSLTVDSPKAWTPILNRYREQSRIRSIAELAMTAVLLAVFWAVMLASLKVGYWLTLLLAVPTAGFLGRIFMLQHDCGHGASFRRRATNDWVGRVLGVFTLTPYDIWRRDHAIHHASAGNLDRRGIGDVKTLTVREYLGRSRFGKLTYRLYRHPAILFGIGPAYLFMLENRLPLGQMRNGWTPWVSTMATNAAIAALVVAMMWLVGVGPFLMVHLPVVLLAASIGVWLFYIQHQFEETYWEHEPDWSVQEAALHGSSHYDLPKILRWFTGNIGVHHVHHLCSRIPFYRLYNVIEDYPELAGAGRMTLLESLRCVRLTLWCEDRCRLVSFRQARSQA
jgi:omega-6 fatty acid desaturase (delta-12 desaturase)